MLGFSRLRRRSGFGASEKHAGEAPNGGPDGANGAHGSQDGGVSFKPPIVKVEAPSSLPPPQTPQARPPASYAVPPPPPLRVTGDEDEIIERLFPQSLPGRPAGPVPSPPTIDYPDGAAVPVPDRTAEPPMPVPPRPPDAAGIAGAAVVLSPVQGVEAPRVHDSWSQPRLDDLDHADVTAGAGFTAKLAEDGHPTALLVDGGLSDADFGLRAGMEAAEQEVPAKQGGKRSIFSALLVIGHLLLLNGLSIPVTAYIIHRLRQLKYGQWAAASELVMMTGLMATLGLRQLFVRAIAQKPELAEEELAYQLGLRAVLTLGAGTLAAAIAGALHLVKPHEYNPVVLTCVGVAIVTLGISTVNLTLADLLQGLHKMKTYSAVNFIAGIVLTGASFAVALVRPDPVLLMLAYLTGPLVGMVCYIVMARKHVPIRVKFSLAKFRELLRESRNIGAYQISVAVRDKLDRVLLPALTGMSKFGFYNGGIMPADRLFIVPEGFITAFFPTISRSHHQDEKSSSHHVLHLMVTSLVCCTPLALLVTYLADPIARILFRHDPSLCAEVIRITIWAVPLRGIQQPMGCALQASGRHDIAAKTGILATIVSVTLTVALIWTMGIRGASWSWVARAAVSTLFLIPPFVKTFPTVYPRVPVLRILVGAGLMGAVLWVAMHFHFRLSTWITLSLGALAAILVYFVAIVLLRVVEVSDLKLMFRRRAA